MKKVLFAISLVLLVSCSVKTNEEKARELIEPKVKANLIKPESYEFAQMQLDSCFSDSQQNPEAIAFALKVAKLFKTYKYYVSAAKSAESSMTFYAPSYRYSYQSAYFKQQYQVHKTEMGKAKRKAADTKENIIQLYKDNWNLIENLSSDKHEFIGWMCTFAYRAETIGGMKSIGEELFYLNQDLTEITYRFTKEDVIELESAGLDDLKYEFENE